MGASQEGHTKCVESLLQGGADANIKDKVSVVFLVRKYSGCPKNIILQGNHSDTKQYSLCQTTVEHEEIAH